MAIEHTKKGFKIKKFTQKGSFNLFFEFWNNKTYGLWLVIVQNVINACTNAPLKYI